ncbi:hypothetical protein CSC67_10550 [Pusillimonas caeni]|uniref:hypothetical protein n=1 Tax=Pusillimonas caeni TaxID=1348472 RepID=UPI000E59AE73|nr:hypothetical protein [Pusillimonas caeni]TFL13691.1 hypothetical protein CSC67_10550 [Pusillimonas caeni]
MAESTYILCLDEGHGPVNSAPNDFEGTTALMVNPSASQSVLLDATISRVARIIDVTKPWLDLENEDFDFPREDAIRMLITLCAMSQEVHALLKRAQDSNVPQLTSPSTKGPRWACDLNGMRKSYLQTVEAAEALVNAVNIQELDRLPGNKEAAIVAAIFEMEGHLGAARNDFLGVKEVCHE